MTLFLKSPLLCLPLFLQIENRWYRDNILSHNAITPLPLRHQCGVSWGCGVSIVTHSTFWVHCIWCRSMRFGKPHIFWQCGFCSIILLAHVFVTDAKLPLVSCVAAPKHASTAMAAGMMVTTLSMFLQNIFLHWTRWGPRICQTNRSPYLPVWYIWMIFLHAQKALLAKLNIYLCRWIYG